MGASFKVNTTRFSSVFCFGCLDSKNELMVSLVFVDFR